MRDSSCDLALEPRRFSARLISEASSCGDNTTRCLQVLALWISRWFYAGGVAPARKIAEWLLCRPSLPKPVRPWSTT